MFSFTAVLHKFDKKGEKTGWTYIEIPVEVTNGLKPDQKTSFRVTGTLDEFPIRQVALIPMGWSDGFEGTFIMAINATMRRGIRKEVGATVRVVIKTDDSPVALSADFLACLQDDTEAHQFFETLPKGHQNYFSKWIDDAKTAETKANRIAKALRGLSMRMGYSEMIRYFKNRP
ncbi:YdeI/OmpD-associated family protein [Spirosoma oryzicola]|uniref:YdeI/OmpD-associated family protein n=1 Tax=Spirosoma oryzicola TaxID=2898794 RepID=UPI001E29F854|nr:YdeI/OmpD-associated family protein [Spirosoma oryzicola]UHG92747.1 YdeI/OmpD-associated family protein [Spirosoma oryzicola]